jgi:hsp70-interacting protein
LIQYLAHTPIPTILSFLSPSTPAKTRAKAVYALSGLLKHSASGISQFNSADGWPVLRSALEDSDINVRRKTAFLLNTLLVPSSPVDALPSQTQATGSTSGSTSTTLHHESQNANQGPVHANTHASMISDPKSVDTSTATLAAFRDQGILKALVDGLTHPVPYGPDGDTESDVDFEEKVVGYVLPPLLTIGHQLTCITAHSRRMSSLAEAHSLLKRRQRLRNTWSKTSQASGGA